MAPDTDSSRRTHMLKKLSLTSAAVALALSASSALASVSAQDVAKLGTTLTPFGAEKAGNAAGTIPAWTGGITQAPAGYKTGQHHPDPFPEDKPLFTITKANLDQYKANLTPGQIALFNAYPNSFQMPIYQTR